MTSATAIRNVHGFMRRFELINRAYCATFAMARPDPRKGIPADAERMLTFEEAANIVSIVQDVEAGHVQTELDRLISKKLSPAIKHYISSGEKDEAVQ